MAIKKKAEPKPRPEKYEKSNVVINGAFDDAMSVFFAKDKKPKPKGDTGGSVSGG